MENERQELMAKVASRKPFIAEQFKVSIKNWNDKKLLGFIIAHESIISDIDEIITGLYSEKLPQKQKEEEEAIWNYQKQQKIAKINILKEEAIGRNLNIDDYRATVRSTEPIDILKDYLKTIGVDF